LAGKPSGARKDVLRESSTSSLVDRLLTEINTCGIVASDSRINMASGRRSPCRVSCFDNTLQRS
jgi:hypothetical protein